MSAQKSPLSKKSWSERSRSIQPTVIGEAREDLVDTHVLDEERNLPLVVEPRVAGVDLMDWVRSNGEWIDDKLHDHGGILFRGFGLGTPDDFQSFLAATGVDLMYYVEGATPRTQLSEKVYTSTEFPSDQRIALHNELCYVSTWPMRIFFYCVTAADEGGATPIADVRQVLRQLSPETRRKFREKGWMLVRNFGDGFGPDWRTSYRVENRQELEEYLTRADIEFTWKDENRVRTTQVRPAIAAHPVTGEEVWFNHIAFWHLSSLQDRLRDMFVDEFGAENLPYNTYYGDGSVIEDEVASELRAAYDAVTVEYPWQEGDALMLDNMLVAHGRSSFSGDRKILTAMGNPCSDRGVPPPAATAGSAG